MFLMVSDDNLAIYFGHTVAVRERHREVLFNRSLESVMKWSDGREY